MTLRKCDPDTCPPDHVQAKYIVQCHICSEKSHLPCYDIVPEKSRVFITLNIVFVCDECLADKSPARKAAKSLIQATLKPGDCSISNTPLTSRTATTKTKVETTTHKMLKDLTSQMTKTTEQLDLLKQSVNRMDAVGLSTKIDNNTETLHSLERCVTQMNSTVVTTTKQQHENWANVVAAVPQQHNVDVPQKLSVPNNSSQQQHEARAVDAETKIAIKRRTLLSGKSEKQGLGSAVTIGARKPAQMTRNRLSKSIYVSRLETDLTVDHIKTYIKQQMPNVDEKHFALFLLAKKGVDLSEYTYISYRLQCTEELYSDFMSPDFWPSHVEFGDFVEKRKPSRASLNDFVNKPAAQSTSGALDDAEEMSSTDLTAAADSKNGDSNEVNDQNQ